ncbi:diketogulonate reductase-like aldo/keto reductase [Frondihabitans sp. PhB188]|uniref:aldo/keto reductase family protein n=1 Tax=Frondihabitans sp. PhB188 TaxID=2485200 RepID=UPI000F46349F|nr:aldo/keto reductase [Frondihabitans sp. PhB188]ROQ40783.1 diketogulonate reductase-like aldo/keto reductase [Frondihabitans sp. PhB188]
MPSLTDTFTLSNDVEIPKIGFGTWQIPDGPDAYDSVAAALKAGYRHIDTARAYGNEASVARAIRDSGIPRDEIFVTTKLPAEIKDHDEALASFETTMSALEMDYVDLYLIHAPWPWTDMGSDHRTGNQAVWKALEGIHASGRARSIGISNFTVDDIESLMETATVTPHVNQIRWYVGYTQDETTAYCQQKGILVEGYSPLATGAILDSADLAGIAAKYGKSVAQLCIRYLLEKDVLPLPKTTSAKRAAENADVDFEISADDLAALDALTDPTA